jgi:hypothetical protein
MRRAAPFPALSGRQRCRTNGQKKRKPEVS